MPHRPLPFARRRALSLLALLAALPAFAAAQASSAPPRARRVTKDVATTGDASVEAMTEVVAAERAFARLTRERGIREGFLANLADDGIVFRPRAVRGKLTIATEPPQPGLLEWEPAWGAASAAGDLGFTTGPYTFRRTADDTLAAHGTFNSVWARQPDGTWKVLLDLGVPGPAQPAPAAFEPRPTSGPMMRAAGRASSAAVMEGARGMLIVADRGIAAAGAADGPAAALKAVGAEDVRLVWPGGPPVAGRDAAAEAIAAHVAAIPGATYAWQTLDARVARSGDLGVTWGTYDVRANGALAETGNYMRVWVHETAGWRVLLDVASPVR